MRNSGRVYFYSDPVKESQSKPLPQAIFKKKQLWRLSPSELWTILEWIEAEIGNGRHLYHPKGYVKALRKRQRVLSRELLDRIEWDEWQCKKWGPSFQDGHLIDNYGWDQGDYLDPAIDACRKADENGPRRSLCKIPNGPYSGFNRPLKEPDPRNKIRFERPKTKT